MSFDTIAIRQLKVRMRASAEQAIGCETSVRFKTGVIGTAVATGIIIQCEPLEPRATKSGLSLKGYWKITLRLPSGKLHEATVDRLPRREHAQHAERPAWDALDELARAAQALGLPAPGSPKKKHR